MIYNKIYFSVFIIYTVQIAFSEQQQLRFLPLQDSYKNQNPINFRALESNNENQINYCDESICSECSQENQTQCLVCIDSTLQTPYCQCEIIGFYFDEELQECQPCQEGCNHCISSTECDDEDNLQAKEDKKQKSKYTMKKLYEDTRILIFVLGGIAVIVGIIFIVKFLFTLRSKSSKVQIEKPKKKQQYRNNNTTNNNMNDSSNLPTEQEQKNPADSQSEEQSVTGRKFIIGSHHQTGSRQRLSQDGCLKNSAIKSVTSQKQQEYYLKKSNIGNLNKTHLFSNQSTAKSYGNSSAGKKQVSFNLPTSDNFQKEDFVE